MHTRQPAIDNLRGFLVLLVILGHTALGLVGMYHDNSSSFLFVNHLYKIIYSFHMSCFIAISGYLFQGLPQKTLSCYGRQIQHKAIALLIPYTLCSIIYWCIKYAMSSIVHTPVDYISLLKIPYRPIEFFWYLYALFLIYALAYGLDVFVHNTWLLFAFFTIVALLSYGHFAYEGFNYIAGYMMYFYLGCLIRRYHDTICKRSVCLCLLLMSLFSEILYLNYESIAILQRLTATIITLFFFSAFLLGQNKKSALLETFGTDSMPFYIMHVTFVGGFRIILSRLGITNLLLNCILGFLGSVIVCYLLYEKFFKHIKYIDFLFYPSKYIRKSLL